MPILKVISGHGNTGRIRRYLEKDGRALGRDFMNLPMEEWIEETRDEQSIAIDWDAEMDATRRACGGNDSWRGLRARTFKHFVISPDPQDAIDLKALRELSHAWVDAFWRNHEVAIIYHDDNEGRIPHAHIVVNSIDLETGRRMQTRHPEDLNRALQDMARERGLIGLSNDMPRAKGAKKREPRSHQAVYFGRAEREIMREGGYSWVGDIRARVALAKNTAKSEADFMEAIRKLGLEVADNSRSARRDDWVFSLANEPSKKVSGERLGFTFGKQMLKRRFERQASYKPEARSANRIRHHAMGALELNDLKDLSRLSAALETCAKFDIRFADDFDRRLATLMRRGQAESRGYKRLQEAKSYMEEKHLMGERPQDDVAVAATTRRRGSQQSQTRIRTQEQEQRHRRERSER